MPRCEKVSPRSRSITRQLFSLLAVTFLSLVPLTVTALPVTTASLAIADRELVRDPYKAFSGLLAQGSISAQSINPAVTSPFLVPPPIFVGGFAPISIGPGARFPSFVAPLKLDFVPWVGSAFSSVNQNGTLRNVTIGATSVPDAGATGIALFGAAMIGLVAIRTRYFRR
jgi:hypothetical protein